MIGLLANRCNRYRLNSLFGCLFREICNVVFHIQAFTLAFWYMHIDRSCRRFMVQHRADGQCCFEVCFHVNEGKSSMQQYVNWM